MQPATLLKSPTLFRQQCFINGAWCDAENTATFNVTNPADNTPLGTVPDMSFSDVTHAIAAASAAFAVWRTLSAEARGRRLLRWHELMMQHQEDLAILMTLEQGKPLTESRGEIAYAASFLKWFAEESRRNYGDTIPGAKAEQHIVTLRQPIGVCAAITPWNFPSSMITRKAGAALAAGCTLIVKPASATPYSALALAELAQRADIPAGVFNVVTGNAGRIAETLTNSPIVRKLSFTGSTETGKKLMAACAHHLQKISLELGGNAPFVVFDDADLDNAVAGAMAAKFRNTGQTCICVNRFIVQRTIADAFCDRLAQVMTTLKVGNGLDDGVNQSCLINIEAAEKFRAHLTNAIDYGATRVCGGDPHPLGGSFVYPALIRDVTPQMRVFNEETFGPLAAITLFDDEADAIALANNTRHGLAAYVYSENIHRCWRMADAIESGMVGINEIAISNAAAPFGGMKESGIGREGSRYGMDAYLEIKYVCFGG